MSILRLPFLAVLLLAAATPAVSQVVRGRVTDGSTREPIASALVTLLDSAGSDAKGPTARSDSAGAFAIYAPGLGDYRIRFTRVGYLPATSDVVRLGNTEIARVNVSMSALAETLAPITVVEKRPLTIVELDGLDGFEFRRARGYGHYLVADELVGMGSLNDIVATGKMTGVRWVKAPDDLSRSINDRECNAPGRPTVPRAPPCRKASSLEPGVMVPMMPGCALEDPPVLILDAKRVDSWQNLEGRVMMDFVAGIEIYRRNELPWTAVGTPPVEFSPTSRLSRPCAVIMVWTKGWFQAMEQSARAAQAKSQAPR